MLQLVGNRGLVLFVLRGQQVCLQSLYLTILVLVFVFGLCLLRLLALALGLGWVLLLLFGVDLYLGLSRLILLIRVPLVFLDYWQLLIKKIRKSSGRLMAFLRFLFAG